jgi:hypothetical protein
MVSGQEPVHPARKRKNIKLGMLVATAHATVKMIHYKLQTWYAGSLPYNSERGAMIRGPHANPRR